MEQFNEQQNVFHCSSGRRRYAACFRHSNHHPGFRQVVGLSAFRLLPARHVQFDRRLAGAQCPQLQPRQLFAGTLDPDPIKLNRIRV
jgi:hypothetical protein